MHKPTLKARVWRLLGFRCDRSAARCTLALALASIFASAPCLAEEINVGSRDYPTLAEAITALPRIREALPAGEPVIVRLPAGVFRVSQPIEIDARHGGTPDNPLIIQGAGAGRTRIVGAAPTLPRPATPRDGAGLGPDTLAIDLPAGATGLVRRGAYLSVPRGGFMLFQGGARLREARWPAKGYIAGTLAEGGTTQNGSHGPSLRIDGAMARTLAREPELWAGGYWSADWAFELAPVASLDSRGLLTLAPLKAPMPVRTAARFYLANTIAGLRPGTFVVLPERRVALFRPLPSDAPPAFQIAVSSELLVLKDTRQVRISDIAFDRSLGTAVRVENSRDIAFSDIAVRQTGGHGIAVLGGRNVTIRRSVVSQTAERGVLLIGGNRESLTPAGHGFFDGIIADFGQESPSYRGGIQLAGVGNRVTGSFITGGDHLAVQLSGNDHEVTGNEISHVLRDTEDAGAIYMGRDWSERGMRITGNYIHDIGSAARRTNFLSSIYLDDQASGVTITGNVMIDGQFGVVIGGGRDNLISGNFFAGFSRAAVHADNRGMTWQNGRTNGELAALLAKVPVQSDAWKGRYRDLSNLRPAAYGRPENNRLVGNWIISGSPLQTDAATLPFVNNEGWRTPAARGTTLLDLRSQIDGMPGMPPLAERQASLVNLAALRQVPDQDAP
ncbi:MAG TPA: right-handed parallel beta-helix repeat-containing protein [Novosphingobium sp.]|nr:right-handed parallel beta-helix repeat-containing protein [Novosphingobium sp.]